MKRFSTRFVRSLFCALFALISFTTFAQSGSFTTKDKIPIVASVATKSVFVNGKQTAIVPLRHLVLADGSEKIQFQSVNGDGEMTFKNYQLIALKLGKNLYSKP